MKVSEVIDRLKLMPQEAELLVATENQDKTEGYVWSVTHILLDDGMPMVETEPKEL